nr:hypothetical protein 29 [Paracoccaceae bacterium]
MPNVNDYIRAAQAVGQSSVDIFSAIADNSPRYDQLARAGITESAKNKANTVTNEADAAIARMRAERDSEITDQNIKSAKKIRDIKRGARMTGKLAGGAALIGYGAMQLNKKDKVDPTLEVLGGQITKVGDRITSVKTEIERLKNIGENLKTDNTDDSDNNDLETSLTQPTNNSDNTVSSSQPISKKGTYSVSEMTKLALDAGFTPEQAKTMGAIGFAESGGRAGVDTVQSGTDPNKSNEYSVGLFQINTQAHGDKLAKLGYTADDLRDPAKAAQLAKMVYDEVGSFKPWSVFTSGKYLKYLD